MLKIIIYIFIAVIMAVTDIIFVIRMIEDTKRNKIIFAAISTAAVILCITFTLLKGRGGVYAILLLLIMAVLNIITIYDIRTMYIPSILLVVLNTLGLAASFFVPDSFFIKSILGAWIITGMCFLLGRKVKNGIGSGDLFCMSGLMMCMSFEGMMNFMFSSLFLSLIYGIICMIAKKKTMKTELSFAPFMLVGYICMILFS